MLNIIERHRQACRPLYEIVGLYRSWIVHGTLNTYLLALVDREVARPTVAEVLERAAQRAERATGSALDIVAAQRAERDDRVAHRVTESPRLTWSRRTPLPRMPRR